jgi:hypothetical protein
MDRYEGPGIVTSLLALVVAVGLFVLLGWCLLIGR